MAAVLKIWIYSSVLHSRNRWPPLAVLELNLRANPPLSRALVFSDTIDFDMEQVMALGVWNNHTRLLLPSAEKTPKTMEKLAGSGRFRSSERLGRMGIRRLFGRYSIPNGPVAVCNLCSEHSHRG